MDQVGGEWEPAGASFHGGPFWDCENRKKEHLLGVVRGMEKCVYSKPGRGGKAIDYFYRVLNRTKGRSKVRTWGGNGG